MSVNRIVDRCIQKGNLPAEILPRVPLIEIAGAGRVLIEKHRGIASYGEEEICVYVSFGRVCIYGNGLALACMTQERLVITGEILMVTLQKEANI